MDQDNTTNQRSQALEILAILAWEIYSSAKDITTKESTDSKIEWGMLFAYAEVLSKIKFMAAERGIDLDYLFNDQGGFDPYSVLSFRPMGWPIGKDMIGEQ